MRRQPIFPPSLSVVLAAAATAGPSPAGPDRAAAPSGDGATTALAVDAVRVAGGVAGEQASGAEAALPLGKLAALANYYSLQARDAAHRVAALVWRVGLGCSLAVLFWVLVGLAPAWRAAFGAGG
ncbi:MAG: hypothetical protein M1531_04505 [Chloroflexi bacterium]|nr:hypothetical protein [Chloroflexota bacterium]